MFIYTIFVIGLHFCCSVRSLYSHTYAAVFIVEVDDQAEGATAHWLGRDERVLKSGLAEWRHHCAQLQSSEVLDVKLKVLRVAEGSVQRLDYEIFTAFIGEAQQELYNVVGWKVWNLIRSKHLSKIFNLLHFSANKLNKCISHK